MLIKPQTKTFSIFDRKQLTIMMAALFCVFLFMAQVILAVPDQPVIVESKVDKTEVTIGDPIHYTITAKMQKDIELSLPPLGSNLGEFEIQDYQMTGPIEQEGQVTQSITYTIAVYDTGSYHIPPVEINYKTPEDEQRTISTQEIEITVKAVAPEEAADIKDIKGPLEMKRNWAPYRKALLWPGLALILTLLLFGGIWCYRKRKSSPITNTEIPLRPAHEIAYEELKIIWDNFLRNNQVKEFYLCLSEIIRQYFSRRYQINALEATTEELIQELKDHPLHWQQKSLISHFLDECDMVKFAKYIPNKTETERTYQTAFQIIDNTRIDNSRTRTETTILTETEISQG